jgi:hypothetical protein
MVNLFFFPHNKIWHDHFIVIATKIEDHVLNQVYEDLDKGLEDA